MLKRRCQGKCSAPSCSLDRSCGWEQITDTTDSHTRAWGTPTDGKPNFVAVLSLLSQPRWSHTGESLWEDSGLAWLQISCPTSASHPRLSLFLPLKRVKEEQRIFPDSQTMAFNHTLAPGTFLMLPTRESPTEGCCRINAVTEGAGNRREQGALETLFAI